VRLGILEPTRDLLAPAVDAARAADVVVLVVGAGLGLGVLGSWVSDRTYLIR
jgi:hypothetical protein